MAPAPAEQWSFDDMIAYTLSACPQQATSILTRIRDAPDADLLGGDELFSIRIIHLLSEREDLRSIDSAARVIYGASAQRLEDDCLRFETGGAVRAGALPRVLELTRPLRILWAARALARMLDSEKPGRRAGAILKRPLTSQLICACAEHISSGRAARALAVAADNPAMAVSAASLLVRIDPSWRPARCVRLSGADLRGIAWPGALLRRAELRRTDLRGGALTGADLIESDLTCARAAGARFAQARLDDATCAHIEARGADFAAAHLAHVDFTGARLVEASFRAAEASDARFTDADLTSADFSAARLDSAWLQGAVLHGTNFSRAYLRSARLQRADLRTATLDRADLARATLIRANLEGVAAAGLVLITSDLSRALLTGASLHRAEMNGAILHSAGLAHIELEDADLRHADFAHAAFHLGSSRSGLVGSVIAGEGSRTGFYTDDFDDRSHKAPEAIRKASLCGADLRGAAVADCDFYLVDLRQARYDTDQAAHFKRCGAIL